MEAEQTYCFCLAPARLRGFCSQCEFVCLPKYGKRMKHKGRGIFAAHYWLCLKRAQLALIIKVPK